MKIVLNGCYGGFNLSYEAMALYLHARNKEAFFYVDIPTWDEFTLVDRKYKRITLAEAQENKSHFIYCTTEDQGEILNEFPRDVVNFRDIERTDPILVSVVETMGSAAASGRYAELIVEEIPDGTLYKIDYYDGVESLITQDDDDWQMASHRPQDTSITHRIQNMWETIRPTKEDK